MPEPSDGLSAIAERFGFFTGVFSVLGLGTFTWFLGEGFHLRNQGMMMAAVFFSIAGIFYLWHVRDQSSVSYHGEPETHGRGIPWGTLVGMLACGVAALFFGYVAATGHIPTGAELP